MKLASNHKFVIAVASVMLVATALASSPDYAVTTLSAPTSLSVGQCVDLSFKVTNQGDDGFSPYSFVFLVKEGVQAPVLDWGKVGPSLDDTNDAPAIGVGSVPGSFDGVGGHVFNGEANFTVPPVPSGKYSLIYVIQPAASNPSPGLNDAFYLDANPSNNEGRMTVDVGVPDLIVTNAILTRPTVEGGPGSLSFDVMNIGDGAVRSGSALFQATFSHSTSVDAGGGITDGFELLVTDGMAWGCGPHPEQPELAPGEFITITASLGDNAFKNTSTFYLVVNVAQTQDLRFPLYPNDPRPLQRFANGGVVEARTDNNVLVLPIHVARPQIIKPPISQSQRLGSAAVFGVEAADFNSFQWLFNGQPITGQTNATLTMTNLQPEAAGRYSVQAVNELGSETSDEAVLTVQLPPVITQPPVSQIVGPGSPVTLTVAASGDAPFAYQWRRNGQNIPGATDANYTFNATEAGQFTVVVTNEVGSAESAPATVSLFSVETFAGTILAGPLGGTYRIEYRNELDPADAWQTATTVTLTVSPIVWIDHDSPKDAHRFYRAVLVP